MGTGVGLDRDSDPARAEIDSVQAHAHVTRVASARISHHAEHARDVRFRLTQPIAALLDHLLRATRAGAGTKAIPGAQPVVVEPALLSILVRRDANLKRIATGGFFPLPENCIRPKKE